MDFFLPLRQLGSYFHVAMNGMTSTKRIFALLDEPDRAYGDRRLPQGPLDVTTCDLGFAYAESARPALHDVTLTMPARSLTAIVGESGSGKSTLAALVAGELLGFAYAESARPALHDVTLTMPARSLTAIVGESGSGKSTLAALVAGELEGYDGALRIG